MKTAIRIAAKAGFLSKAIWRKHLSHGHRSWRNRQWKSLIDDGYMIPCHDYGFTSEALILSRRGIAAAIQLGLDPVSPPGAKNLRHDDDLIGVILSLEKQQLISRWLTESELKRGKMAEFSNYDTVRKPKFPDLILQMKHPQDVVLWAVELERTRKEFTCYYDMVQSYGGTSRINAVLVIAAAPSIETNIQRAMDRLAHPQSMRPFIFTHADEFLKDPANGELRMGTSRSSIAKAVARWASPSSLESPESGNFARASTRATGAYSFGQNYGEKAGPKT